MDPARIASLLAPFLAPDSLLGDSLTDQQLSQVSTYLDLLLKWNARINLTSVRQPEEIVTRHFGESFFAARQLCHPERRAPSPPAVEAPPPSLDGLQLVDVGSGAGFPGLPIKVYAPELSVALIESNHKKATFLRETIRALTLTNIDVFAGRAEEFPGTAAIVTLRAVEKPELALAAAARLVSPGGRLALFLGAAQASATPGLLSGFSWGVPIPLPGSSGRALLIGASAGQESD
ncbi:MAG: 16S rRNA (guanine(527)-N(7))-methyltransferase RsmG [Acidobacteriota bacterium]|nr:16S rRNA (guanine(527)-N(7))-methyltransferase RsmG [Acidobacteriota bacterium]